MNIFTELKKAIASSYQLIYQDNIDDIFVGIELPKDPLNGDLSTNIAMIVASQKNEKPREVALKFKEHLSKLPFIAHIEIAGPGFINFTIKALEWQRGLTEILLDDEYFNKVNIGNNEKTNIEYVSANPTGPMHVGHIRCAIYGDVLASILAACGYDVVKEYYINDAGSQVKVLTESIFSRYKEIITGEKISLEEGLYVGEYLIDVGKKLADQYQEKLLSLTEEARFQIIKEFGIHEMMILIKEDLHSLGIKHDVFTSEQELHDKGKIEEVIAKLEKQHKIYTGILPPPLGKIDPDWSEKPQLLFRSTEFGDDQDRTVQKTDGSWTYLAGDLALVGQKLSKGFKHLICVLGADHIGYIKRINAIVEALSNGEVTSIIKTCQLVKLIRNGQVLKMSKRAGNFITAKQIIDEVGKDNIRFMMLTRHNDMELEFDFEKVKAQTKDNPIYYVQYAHVRTVSILNNAKNNFPSAYVQYLNGEYDLSHLDSEEEIQLIKLLLSWSKVLESAAVNLEPHRLSTYLLEVASKFHSLWNLVKENNDYRFINENNIPLTIARLALVKAVQKTFANGLKIIGIIPENEM